MVIICKCLIIAWSFLADNVNLNPSLASYLRFVRRGAVRYSTRMQPASSVCVSPSSVCTKSLALPCLRACSRSGCGFWRVHVYFNTFQAMLTPPSLALDRFVKPTPFETDAKSASKGVAASKSPRNISTYFRGAVECKEQTNK